MKTRKEKPLTKLDATGAANRKSIPVLLNMPATGGMKNIPKSEKLIPGQLCIHHR